MGSITWTVSGQATVSPSVTYDFSSVYLIMDLADEDNVVTLTATATDALGVAPPVQKQKAFNQHIPTGLNPIAKTPEPPFPQAGTDIIGCGEGFIVQVMPQNSNFNRTSLRENMANDYTWPWPDGTNDKIAAFTTKPIPPKNITAGGIVFPSCIVDLVATKANGITGALLPVAVLKNMDFDKPDPAIAAEYQDKAGKWIAFETKVVDGKVEKTTGTRPRHWTGASQAGRCGFVSYGELWGEDQGPFKKPN